jgi:hypothetical protein
MGMKQTIDVLNRMEADGIIGRYAIAGAVATYNYVEPTVTEDLDVLVAFDRLPPVLDKPGLVTLGPILSHLATGAIPSFDARESSSKNGRYNSFPSPTISTPKR